MINLKHARESTRTSKWLFGSFSLYSDIQTNFKEKTAKMLKYWVVFLTKTGLSMWRNVLPLYRFSLNDKLLRSSFKQHGGD